MAAAEPVWSKEIVPRVMLLVAPRLAQRDLHSLLLVNSWCHRTLLLSPSLWQVLDFHGMNQAGDRLVAALSLPRYHHIKQINLEFAQDIEDTHLSLMEQYMQSLYELQSLNLNGCQKVSDRGVEAVASSCPRLRSLSIYWNVRLSDAGIIYLTKNCKCIVELNLSGCKNITDKSLDLIADTYKKLEALNLTRCIKLTDAGLQQIVSKCSFLRSFNLYAVSSFTDNAYQKFGLLRNLTFLDLCGAQNLSDSGLSCIAACRSLLSQPDMCVRITDVGVLAIAQGCTSLEYLSLFGIIGVTDRCLEALAKTCSSSLTTLDVNGCIGIKKRSRGNLLHLFPNLKCFKVHS